MNRQREALGLLVLVAAMVITQMGWSPLAHAEDPGPEQAQEWKKDKAIQLSIYIPQDNTYLPINHWHELLAVASDSDCYRVGDSWYLYGDDVTSGSSWDYWHITWEFVTSPEEGYITDPYGPVSGYVAADYIPGSEHNVRDIVLNAMCDDFNFGDDTYGWNDDPTLASVTIKVWQITVAVEEAGTDSDYYDGDPYPEVWGARDLGWIKYSVPAGCQKYGANTQIRGTIPEGPGQQDPEIDYDWKQELKGYVRVWKIGAENWTYTANDQNWVPDPFPETPYRYADEDSHSPDNGPDCRMIFLRDSPGFNAGPDNNNNYPPPDTIDTYERDRYYRDWVEIDGLRASNISAEWRCKLQLMLENGKWKLYGSHIPAE